MPNYPAKFQINPIYGFWEKLDESFRTDVCTDGRTWVKHNAPDESSRGHKNVQKKLSPTMEKIRKNKKLFFSKIIFGI